MEEPAKVVIVGAGLVGSLAAIYMSRLGYHVEVFEKRFDIRLEKEVEGRSINLALSYRGIKALQEVGLDLFIFENALPMKGRMIHSIDQDIIEILYGDFGETINSVSRRTLNEIILDAAEKEEHINFHFGYKLLSMDVGAGTIKFRPVSGIGKTITENALFILGCDGAFSSVRRELLKISRTDFSQEFAQLGYKEFRIPPSNSGDWSISNNHLHIWPRKEFMLIALPNLDKSFTATLFYPYDSFKELSKAELLQLFKLNFPDALKVIGEDQLVSDFEANPIGALVTMKCSQYHYSDKVLLLGDAAHAMVPFFGQGMNSGFEDLTVLNGLLRNENFPNLESIFAEYSRIRVPDGHAICDLALYNSWEMSTAVNSWLFRARRTMEGFLHRLMPRALIPLYSMVTFTNMRYSEIYLRDQRQRNIINTILTAMSLGLIFGISALTRQLLISHAKIK